METVTVPEPHHEEPRPIPDSVNPSPVAPTLAVSAMYLLSEEGRKRSLLAGGDGRATQRLTLHVPTHRLHLVSVDADGAARLKLRPRYELDRDQQLVRIDAPPTYDTPPDLETLFQQAARNHQLERTYESQGHVARLNR